MEEFLSYFIIILLAILSFLVIWTTRRVGQIFAQSKRNNTEIKELAQRRLTNLFQQLQLVRILEYELGFEQPLPPLRGFAASPDFLLLTARYVLASRPAVVVECSSGVSTVVLARCMQMNGGGKVYSLEHDVLFAEKTRENLRLFGVAEWAEVIVAPIVPRDFDGKKWNWYETTALPDIPVDMLVVDGPPHFVSDNARYPAGPALFPRLKVGGKAFLDDADREQEKWIVDRWKREFPGFTFENNYCEKGCISITRTK